MDEQHFFHNLFMLMLTSAPSMDTEKQSKVLVREGGGSAIWLYTTKVILFSPCVIINFVILQIGYPRLQQPKLERFQQSWPSSRSGAASQNTRILTAATGTGPRGLLCHVQRVLHAGSRGREWHCSPSFVWGLPWCSVGDWSGDQFVASKSFRYFKLCFENTLLSSQRYILGWNLVL